MTVLCNECARDAVFADREELCIGGAKTLACTACGGPFSPERPGGMPQGHHYREEAVDFDSWCAAMGFELEVNVRAHIPEGVPDHYWTRLHPPHVEVVENGMLGGVAGNGATIEGAKHDLAKQLAGKRIAIDAYTKDRREHDVPKIFVFKRAPDAQWRDTNPLEEALQVFDATGRVILDQKKYPNKCAQAVQRRDARDPTLDELTSLIATLQDQVSHYQGRVCELLESNTRLLEERRAVDVHYNVEQFHRAAGLDDPRVPTVPPDDVVRYRMRTVSEEYIELLEATYDLRSVLFDSDLVGEVVEEIRSLLEEVVNFAPVKVDLPAWADATVDLDYFVEGSRQAFGIDGRPLLREVQRANMAKFGPGSWKRKDGKQMKPPGWVPPDIAGELRKQGWRG